ncbi:MAG TPA: hypothetical protein VFV68_07370, partial [Agriterribacter sp.]|nr:hypothetical protein [Agriterribacter sp.]
MFVLLVLISYNTSILYNKKGEPLFIMIEFGSTALAILIIGVALGALMALIPFKRLKYSQKFRLTIPICTTLVICLDLYASTQEAYLIRKHMADQKLYKDVQIPQGLDCSSVHDGTFETPSLIIERHGDYQKQTSKISDEVEEFKVKWISDCEYYLISPEDSTDILKVKIIKVTPDGYDCFATIGKWAAAASLKKLKVDH